MTVAHGSLRFNVRPQVKHITWILLVVFCAGMAQVQPVDRLAKAKVC